MGTSNNNKAVLITGASTGIGEACALYLDARGFTVYAGIRTEADADKLESKGSENLIPVFIDVTDPGSIKVACDDLTADLDKDGLYALVNNAGIVVAGAMEYVPVAGLKRQFDVNVFGQVSVTQAFLPLLRKRAESYGTARIVNMSSIAGRSSLPFVGPYSASKHALEALSDAMRLELAPSNIRVSLIEPGAIATPIWEKSTVRARNLFEKAPESVQARYGAFMERVRTRVERSNERGLAPEHVARAVAHAINASSPKTRYLVGWDARLRVIGNALPDKLRDWIIQRLI